MRRAFVAAGLLWLAGCVRIQSLPLDGAEPGDLVVVVFADAAGQVTRAEAFPAAAPPARLSFEAPPQLALLLPGRDLVDERGEVLPAARLLEVRAAPLTEVPLGFGACGRCTAPPAAPPWLVQPGDLCPLPSGLRALPLSGPTLSEDARAALADQLLLAWGGGPCPLVPSAQPSTVELMCPILPPDDPWPSEASRFSIDEQGALAISARGQLALVDAGGSVTRWVGPQAPFGSELVDSGALAGAPGRFLFAYDTSQGGARYLVLNQMTVGDARPELLRAPADHQNLEPADFVDLGDGYTTLIGSENHSVPRDLEPAAIRCRRDGATACEGVVVDRSGCSGPRRGAAFGGTTPDGVALLSNSTGEVLLRRAGQSAFACAGAVPTFDGLQLRPDHVRALGVLGRRLYVCGTGVRVPEGSPLIESNFVASATIAPDFTGRVEDLEWSAADVGRLQCRQLIAGREPGRIWLIGSSDHAAELDASGRVLRMTLLSSAGGGSAPFPEIDRPIDAAARAGAWLALRTADGAYFRGRDAEPMRRVFGPSASGAADVVGAAAREDGSAILVDRDLGLYQAGARSGAAGCERASVVALPAVAGVVGVEATAVSTKLWDGRMAIATVDPFGAPGIAVVDSASLRLLAEHRYAGPSALRLVALAWIGLHQWVGLGSDGRVFQANVERLEEVRFSGVPSGARWRALDGEGPVVWVVGDAAIGRVLPSVGGSLRGEGDWLARLAGPEFLGTDRVAPVSFSAVRALGPDHFVVAAVEQLRVLLQATGQRSVLLWEHRDTPGNAALQSYPRSLGDVGVNGEERIVAITGRPGDLHFAFASGRFEGTLGTMLEVPFTLLGAVEVGAGVVVFGEYGRALALLP